MTIRKKKEKVQKHVFLQSYSPGAALQRLILCGVPGVAFSIYCASGRGLPTHVYIGPAWYLPTPPGPCVHTNMLPFCSKLPCSQGLLLISFLSFLHRVGAEMAWPLVIPPSHSPPAHAVPRGRGKLSLSPPSCFHCTVC